MRLPRGFACEVVMLAALLFFPAAQSIRAQNPPPASPSGQPAGQSSSPVPAAPPASSPAPGQAHELHFVTVKFDYDFGATPPCARVKPKHPCIDQFGIYDTTAGTGKKHRVFLFYVPLPAKQSGVVPITFQSPKQINFDLGWHKLGVGALDDTGEESHMKMCDSCATWINVQTGPSPTGSTPAPGSSTTPPGTTPPASPL